MARNPDGRQGVLGLPPLLALASEQGVDPAKLLHEAGIAASLLEDPRATIPVERVHALVRVLLARTGDPALGLCAARHYDPSTFGLLGAVAAMTPSVREVARLFVQYVHFTFTFFHVAFEDDDERAARILFLDDGELGPLRRFYLDREVAFVYEIARKFWPDSYRSLARSVDIDYPAPAEAERYRQFFPCPVRFGAPRACVVIDLIGDQTRAAPNTLGLHVLREHLSSFGGGGGGGGGGSDGQDILERVRREIRCRSRRGRRCRSSKPWPQRSASRSGRCAAGSPPKECAFARWPTASCSRSPRSTSPTAR